MDLHSIEEGEVLLRRGLQKVISKMLSSVFLLFLFCISVCLNAIYAHVCVEEAIR